MKNLFENYKFDSDINIETKNKIIQKMERISTTAIEQLNNYTTSLAGIQILNDSVVKIYENPTLLMQLFDAQNQGAKTLGDAITILGHLNTLPPKNNNEYILSPKDEYDFLTTHWRLPNGKPITNDTDIDYVLTVLRESIDYKIIKKMNIRANTDKSYAEKLGNE